MYLAIRRATDEDTDSVLKITKESFSLYQEDLHVKYEVKALKETIESTLHDIRENAVFVVYRFGVSPQISNTGFGSALLDAAITYAKDNGAKAVALHTNSKYYSLARYYYGKQFYVHSTTFDRGYVRALFVLELEQNAGVDLSPAFLQ